MTVFEFAQEGARVQLTAYAIAKRIGMKPSSHVKKIILELVNDGWMNQQEVKDLFGRNAVMHWLTTDAYGLLEQTYAEIGASFKIVKSWFEQ